MARPAVQICWIQGAGSVARLQMTLVYRTRVTCSGAHQRSGFAVERAEMMPDHMRLSGGPRNPTKAAPLGSSQQGPGPRHYLSGERNEQRGLTLLLPGFPVHKRSVATHGS